MRFSLWHYAPYGRDRDPHRPWSRVRPRDLDDPRRERSSRRRWAGDGRGRGLCGFGFDRQPALRRGAAGSGHIGVSDRTVSCGGAERGLRAGPASVATESHGGAALTTRWRTHRIWKILYGTFVGTV